MKNICKLFIGLLLLIVSLLSFTIIVSAASSTSYYINCDEFVIYPMNNYFVIPSGIDITDIEICSSSSSYVLNGNTYSQGSKFDITFFEKTSIYDIDAYTCKIDSNTYFFIKEPNLPYISIDTTIGVDKFSRNVKDEYTSVKIFESSGKLIYNDLKNDSYSELKVRGNMTSTYQKKPFQLKLGKKTDLFGMGKAKTYILLANYIDPSFLRNQTVFSLANYLGLDYTSKSQQVMLYIDGQCIGLYQLCEKTQINANRIEIDNLEDRNYELKENVNAPSYSPVTIKGGTIISSTSLESYSYIPNMVTPEDYTGGYLIELDNLYAASEKCKFTTEYGNTYVIKSPEEASKEEVEYISQLFADMESALYSPTGYNKKERHFSEYIDIDSFAKIYAIEELSKDWDAFVGSNFFYKDKDVDGIQSKIYAGPVWDFDNSWGTLSQGTYSKDYGEIWTETYFSLNRPNAKQNLGKTIFSQPILSNLISQYVKDAGMWLLKYVEPSGTLDTNANILLVASACDKVIWGYKNRQSAFIVFKDYINDTESDSAITYLKNFISKRTEALLSTFSYSIDTSVYSEIDVQVDKVELNSQYFKNKTEGSFVYYGDPKDISLKTKDGNNVLFEYANGFVRFRMPEGGIIVYNASDDIVSSETITPATEETTSNYVETTTLDVINETTTNDQTISPKNPLTTGLIIIGLTFVAIVLVVVMILIIVKKRGTKN